MLNTNVTDDITRIVAAKNEETLSGNTPYEAVEQCMGCNRLLDLDGKTYCRTYVEPSAKWMFGHCNLASHVTRKGEEAKKVNPLKASKKAAKGKL